MRNLLFFSFSMFLLSCSNVNDIPQLLDYISFEYVGGTVFSDPEEVTLKEIHLDKGSLLGQEVILRGEIINIGSYHTHMVLADSTARILVVLTEIDFIDKINEFASNGKNVKILGTIDYGKKGLPYILAKSVMFEKKSANII